MRLIYIVLAIIAIAVIYVGIEGQKTTEMTLSKPIIPTCCQVTHEDIKQEKVKIQKLPINENAT